jgi:hypothetical protein
VVSRGDRREDIYLDDVDRQNFIKTFFRLIGICFLRARPD